MYSGRTVGSMASARHFLPWCVAVAAVAAGGACSQSEPPQTPAPARAATVEIVEDTAVGYYDPAEVVVAVGATVTWVNRSGFPHNVVFDGGVLPPSSLFADDETYEVEFNTAGSFAYTCTVHPTMRGSVIVTPAFS
jgi:amicyanin